VQAECPNAYSPDKPNFVKLLQALKQNVGEDKRLIVVTLPTIADFLVGEQFILGIKNVKNDIIMIRLCLFSV
jgi:hypothetical protein